jgi:lysylphosphatidylglycerol synthetase-like protein (DUF2156 family)
VIAGGRGRRDLFALYAALAVVGGILPYTILFPGWPITGFSRFCSSRKFSSPPAGIFAADALLSAAIFLVFVFAEGRRLRMGALWLYPLLVLGIGLCCALPAFLAYRERALD